MSRIERMLPHNISAEKAILGAMLMKNGEAIPKVNELLSFEDFYREEHRIIYQAILDLHEKNVIPDNVSLCDHLKKIGKLDQVGGPTYILALGDVVPTTANIVYHANIVKEKAILRRLIDAGEEIAGAAYDDTEEINKIMDNAEQKIFSITSRDTSTEFEHIRPIINRTFQKINELYESGGGYTGIRTLFFDLDNLTTGLQPSDLILIAARPSMGKTAFALNLASNVSINPKDKRSERTVGIFSLEMSKEQLGLRMLSSSSGIDAQRLGTGRVNGNEWHKLIQEVDNISNGKLFIDDTPGLTSLEVRSRARRLKATQGLDLIVIDYLQLMQGRKSKVSDGNRQQEISEISRSLKALARELNVPIIALSQLSRAVEMRAEKKPQLSDLRESGSLEQDADIVMFLYREDYYNENTENKNLTELIVAKHRNGPTRTIKLQFDKEHIKFNNHAPEP